MERRRVTIGHAERVETANIAAVVDSLMAMATDSDRQSRDQRLVSLLSDDFQLVNPAGVAVGPTGAAAAFDMMSEALPTGTRIVRTSEVESHHGYFRYSWARRRGNDVVIQGVDFGWTDDAGRVQRIVTFDGLLVHDPP